MSIFLEIIKSVVPQVFVNPIPIGLRRITVSSILGWAAPWASSATAALRELRSIGLGYTERQFRDDWAASAPAFKGKESRTPFEQRYAYYYTAYLRDAEGNRYREQLAHYSDEPLTRRELRDVLADVWDQEAEPYTAGTRAESATLTQIRIRGVSVKTGWAGMRPL